jgi:hypothetical protein
MKKLILILSAVAILAACSKKQDAKPTLTPQNATAKDITGKWALVVDTTYTTVNGQTTTAITTNTGGITFIFNANGSGSENIATTVDPFTYTVSSGTIFLHVAATQNSAAGDLNVNITLITATKLVFRSVATDETQVLSFVKE